MTQFSYQPPVQADPAMLARLVEKVRVERDGHLMRLVCPLENHTTFIEPAAGPFGDGVWCDNETSDPDEGCDPAEVVRALTYLVEVLPNRCRAAEDESFHHRPSCPRCQRYAPALRRAMQQVAEQFGRVPTTDEGLLLVEGLPVPEREFQRQRASRLIFKLADRAAEEEIEAAAIAQTPNQWLHGDAVLDLPSVSPNWGPPDCPLTAAGQSTLIFGPDGTGKSTVAQHYTKARLALPGWSGGMLGEPVLPLPVDQSVLYLAADRPIQILEGFQRGLTDEHRALLHGRLTFWQGPPPIDLTTPAGQRWLLSKIEETNAALLVLDSRKDFGDVLDQREVSRLNRLLKQLDAAGVEVVVLHHCVQKGDSLKVPADLTHVFGLREVYSGMGSVMQIKGRPGATDVVLHQVKPIRDLHPPIKVSYDHAGGRAERGIASITATPSAGGGADLTVNVDPDLARREDAMRDVFVGLAPLGQWVPAGILKQALNATRLDREFDGLTTDDGGPVEHNRQRGAASAYRWSQ